MNLVKTTTVEEMRSHLKDRCVDLNLHRPVITGEMAFFYLYNLSGQIVGYQRYNPSFPSAYPGDGKQSNLRDRRYYNYVSSGQLGLFGLESYNLDVPCVFVVEGLFDACRLTSRGACAIAMLTNNPSTSMRNFIDSLGKLVVSVCDNDKAGAKMRKVGLVYETVEDAKDLGEASESFVTGLLEKYNK